MLHVSSITREEAEPGTMRCAVSFLVRSIADVKPLHPKLATVPNDPRALLDWLIAEWKDGAFDLQTLERVFHLAEMASSINPEIPTPITKAIYGLWDELTCDLPPPDPEDYFGSAAEVSGDYGRLYFSRHVCT